MKKMQPGTQIEINPRELMQLRWDKPKVLMFGDLLSLKR